MTDVPDDEAARHLDEILAAWSAKGPTKDLLRYLFEHRKDDPAIDQSKLADALFSSSKTPKNAARLAVLGLRRELAYYESYISRDAEIRFIIPLYGYRLRVERRASDANRSLLDLLRHLFEWVDGPVLVHRWTWAVFLGFPILSLIAWVLANRLLGWTYYLGGSGNEPAGLPAVVWGITTVLPVAFGARLAREPWERFLGPVVWRELYRIGVMTSGGALGGWLFYSFGLRAFVEAWTLPHATQESVIALLWSAVISGCVTLSLPLVYRSHGVRQSLSYLLVVGCCCALTVFTVAVFVVLLPGSPDFEQARGLLAGIALPAGLLYGLSLVDFIGPRTSDSGSGSSM